MNNQINYTDFSPFSMWDLITQCPRKTEKEMREKQILDYLDHVNASIQIAWQEREKSVTIKLDNSLYDSFKLKSELESLGFEVNISMGYDHVAGEPFPAVMHVNFVKPKQDLYRFPNCTECFTKEERIAKIKKTMDEVQKKNGYKPFELPYEEMAERLFENEIKDKFIVKVQIENI